MNYLVLMRVAEGGGNVGSDPEYLFKRYWLAPQPLSQGLAFEVLHCNVATVMMLADFINSANVGMVERGGSTCFTKQPLSCFPVIVVKLSKYFQSHLALECRVLSQVDLAHPAFA